MRLVRSRFVWDCSIAAIATALELSYEEASAGFPHPWRAISDKEAIGNIFPGDVVRFVQSRGLACALDRPAAFDWQPAPCVGVVYVLWVKLPGNHDIEVNGKTVRPRHCVAYDGVTVLDSLRDEPRRLADYPVIELVLGIQLHAVAVMQIPALSH